MTVLAQELDMGSNYQYNQYTLPPKVGPAARWWSGPCDIVLRSLVTRWQQGEHQLTLSWLAEDSSEDVQRSLVHHHPPRRPLILVQNERKVQRRPLEEVRHPSPWCGALWHVLICSELLAW